ncbi:FxLD family lanthipeptide [Nonomuraea sp. NPDC059023]|uniref:FxLD family lanthipeptide n=1 Tax=unclassified Nonomuraea TaxID=2593643 RepID=UPI0036BCFB66
MSTLTIEPTTEEADEVARVDESLSAEEGVSAEAAFDPFNLDIRLVENTPAANTSLRCGTGDTCGSSCPSACTTS